MKKLKFFLVLFFALNSVITFSQKQDTLNNQSIIQLTKIGLKPALIISKISSSYGNYDISTDGLVYLSNEGVSTDVIQEMMKYVTKKQEEIANKKDLNDPLTHRNSGIYYYNPNNTEKTFTRVDPTVMGENKSGGIGAAMAMSATYGLANSNVTSSLAGKSSKLVIENNEPVFYFYFENSSSFNRDNWFFASATSPNEFVLIKLKEKKDSREVVIGAQNAYGSSSGIPNKYKVPFEYNEEAPGVYKVTFSSSPLNKGEYCFTYASSNPSRYSNDKVFDFSITTELPKTKIKSK